MLMNKVKKIIMISIIVIVIIIGIISIFLYQNSKPENNKEVIQYEQSYEEALKDVLNARI